MKETFGIGNSELSQEEKKILGSLITQILNLKSQPELLKQVLEHEMQSKFDDINIKLLTQWILFKINSCKITELADTIACVACIQNEKDKQTSLE